jgi:hypothetical protein
VVMHVEEGKEQQVPALAARLKKGTPIVAVIPKSSLEATVAVMKDTPVAATVVADDLDPATLSAVASRLLYGDVFGLEKLVPWGVKVYSILVGDYQEKSVAISSVSDFAAAIGVRRKYRESIEQCLDEMLMNALYDAPVDQAGKQLFADVPTKTRISLRMEQKAVVQYACDGNTFALSVRDSYGALKGETVVQYLHKCLYSEQQIDRKTGGAGLGLYIISNAATQFVVNIYPGVATEAICTFDLNAAKVQLKNFGVFQEKIDSSGRLVGGPTRLVTSGGGRATDGAMAVAAPPSRGVTGALGAAIVLLLALIAIVAYPRLFGATSAISVTTDPPGATIELDGRAVGSTVEGPLSVPDLEVGQKYKIAARLDGHDPVEQIVSPQRDVSAPVHLTLQPRAATVLFETDPPGAAVVVEGQELGVTPLAVTTFAPGTEVEVTLRRIGYTELTRTVRVPAAGREAQLFTPLGIAGDFGSVSIETDPPGAQVVQNGELMAGLVTPVADHLVQAGRPYTFTLRRAGYMPETRTIKVDAGQRGVPLVAELKPGGGISVDVNVPEARISVAGVRACSNRPSPLRDCPVASGRYRVQITSQRPYVNETIDVTVDGADVQRSIQLGLVEAAPEHTLSIPGAPRQTRRAAFAEGTRRVKVTNTATGESKEKTVRVSAGRTVTVGIAD